MPDPIGLSAFDSLHAEDEPWLGDCFVPPPDFDLIAGNHSALVFGAPGSGKTALLRLLTERLNLRRNTSLTVRWYPIALGDNIPASDAAARQMTHILTLCSRAALKYVTRLPNSLINAPPDIQATITWFFHYYLKQDLRTIVGGYLSRVEDPSTIRSLERILMQPPSNEWLMGARQHELIAELTKALSYIGIQYTYVLLSLDRVDATLDNNLYSFMSVLTNFENRRFVYKVILPEALRNRLASAGVVNRRRIRVYTLSWHPDDLREIVVRRMSLAAGREIADLNEICEDDTLSEWLERTGGDSPRGWLEQVSPLAAKYLRKMKPVTVQEWRTIRKKSPPQLTVDLEEGKVIVGWREIDDLPESSLALLSYLYEHRGRICTRDELYHRAYLPSRYPGVPIEHEFPAEYEGTLDTAISRLRQRIEPDPRRPVYVITKRGKGYKLEHAW